MLVILVIEVTTRSVLFGDEEQVVLYGVISLRDAHYFYKRSTTTHDIKKSPTRLLHRPIRRPRPHAQCGGVRLPRGEISEGYGDREYDSSGRLRVWQVG